MIARPHMWDDSPAAIEHRQEEARMTNHQHAGAMHLRQQQHEADRHKRHPQAVATALRAEVLEREAARLLERAREIRADLDPALHITAMDRAKAARSWLIEALNRGSDADATARHLGYLNYWTARADLATYGLVVPKPKPKGAAR